ncbi:hypothetical protein [Ramlibacter rhizophilus]|uniref:Glycosyltransferase RgtA/B/C/D-like domain-containing protein n=1 Tax=Ramlibacter rhizophilus TaxID=1781167 RepID=A0A4Z0BZY0_9BURK|nr:hypothetical protein [Ramlibacter rhizophilus]TFZ04917.1 hypothetical protein EZ242_03995 [Ramlibacter rhizophilus]
MNAWLAAIEAQVGVFFAVELLLAAGVLALAFAAPRLGEATFARIERACTHHLSSPLRQVLAVGLLALVLRALLLPWLGPSQSVVHDEQSLLLQAQTQLLGRLAMPVHPFWEHFETFHVNQLPAYASVYFPGRSLPLAFGLLIAGDAWVGAWASTVLMAMAAVWMLQGWVSLPLALLGGVLVVMRFGVFSYWVNSYWGGSFSALGAMLVVGALPRLLQRPGWGPGAVFGLGAAILATTRPYEGLLLCVPAAAWLVLQLLRPAAFGWRAGAARAAIPALACVAAAGALLLAHNAATTGGASKTAYEVNRWQYAQAPAFLHQPPVDSARRGPPHMRAFYAEEARPHARRASLAGLGSNLAAKLFHTWAFYVGALLTVFAGVGLWALRRERYVLPALAVFVAGYLPLTWNFPHYAAPAMPLMLIVVMRGAERLRAWSWRGRPAGAFLTRAVPVAMLASLALPAASVVVGVPALEASRTRVCCAIHPRGLKDELRARLLSEEGRHLVLVRSGPHNPVHYELVYNEPEIDRARIVWARRLDPQRDAALMAHFAGRKVWDFDWRPDLPEAHALVPVATANSPTIRRPGDQ